MNHSLPTALIASTLALITGSASGQTRRNLGPEPTLSVHLYDQAQVPTGVLHAATVEVTRLFRAAGIQTTWEQPVAEAPEDRGIDMSDRRSAPSRPPDERPYVVVRLVRGMPASALPGALGFALPFARTGAQVSLFYDRVEALTRSGNAASYVILGHALAHEIGHVLLGSSAHTTSSLMQARWNPASWRLASAGLLAFRPEEAERLDAGVAQFQARHLRPEHEPVLAWSVPRRSPE
jgi:Zn-dependent protease with chaperone function